MKQQLAHTFDLITRDPDFPACGANISALIALGANPETDARRFVEVLQRDVAITLRILRTANSAYYNRSGKPIMSLSHAVVLLGAQSVSQIASGLRLIEHFATKSVGLRELVGISLVTASQSQRLAVELHLPKPEEAYLIGLLRNLGEILVAHYHPKQYAQIIVASGGQYSKTRTASQKILGFTFDELASAIIDYWSLGLRLKELVLSGNELLHVFPRGADADLKIITAFSHAASCKIHREATARSRFDFRSVMDRLVKKLGLSEKMMWRIFELAVEDTKESFAALRLQIDAVRLNDQLARAQSLLEDQAEAEAPPLPDNHALKLVENLVATDDRFDLSIVVNTVLEAVISHGVFTRGVFAIIDRDHENVNAKLACGENSQQLLDKFHFPVSIRSAPVGQALLTRNEFLISLERDTRYATSPVVQLFNPKMFGVWPVVVNGVSAGCLYFDSPTNSKLPNDRQLAEIRHVRDLIGQAIDRKRSKAA